MPSCAKVGCAQAARWRPELVVPDHGRMVVLPLPCVVCDEHRDRSLVHQLAASLAPRVGDLAAAHGLTSLDWEQAHLDFAPIC